MGMFTFREAAVESLVFVETWQPNPDNCYLYNCHVPSSHSEKSIFSTFILIVFSRVGNWIFLTEEFYLQQSQFYFYLRQFRLHETA